MKRVGFATIGQAPRVDIVPAIVESLGFPVDVREGGALDGLDDATIATLAPRGDEYSFATRLADGRQAVLGKQAAEERLGEVVRRLDCEGLDLIVVLCAGARLPKPERTMLLEPQRVVDGITAALAESVATLGIVMPLERQVAQFRLAAETHARVRVTHASPYVGDRFSEAGRELAGCDLVVLHCMGHTQAMRDKVARACGVPTLTAPGMVAGVMRQLLA